MPSSRRAPRKPDRKARSPWRKLRPLTRAEKARDARFEKNRQDRIANDPYRSITASNPDPSGVM